MNGSPTPSHRAIAAASIGVFVVAIVLRVPSCYESFWLDELHSAWCVWGSLGDVTDRAVIGHQSPFYFLGLWFWKQLFGTAEVALRLSSVLALSFSCVVLTIAVAKWTSSTLGGWTAGMVLATEPNALFFGTELRPYAWVILFSSVAVACFLGQINTASRHEKRWQWVTMVLSILLAVLCQPTSLGVLAWLPFNLKVLWLIRDRRRMLQITILDVLLLVIAVAVIFALWGTTLSDSWHQRSIWNSFASATQPIQIWQIWDWTWLLLVPLGMLVLSSIVPASEDTKGHRQGLYLGSLWLAAIAVVSTSTYWTVSYLEWIPLWQRRYFVAVLVLLPCLSGAAVAVVTRFPMSQRWAAVPALVLVLAPMYLRGTLGQLRHYPVALVTRGEGWREATQWIRQRATPKDRVVLDSGLIEARAWSAVELNDDQAEYLLYPLFGPYRVHARSDRFPVGESNDRPLADRGFVIARTNPNQVRAAYAKTGQLPEGSEIRGFGNVTVIRLTGPPQPQR